MTSSQLKFFSSLCCPMRISSHCRSGMKSLFTGIYSSRNTIVASAHACQVIYWFIYLFYLFIVLSLLLLFFFQIDRLKPLTDSVFRTPFPFPFSFPFPFPFHFRFRFRIPDFVTKLVIDTLCSLKWRVILPLLMSITGATKSKWRTKKLVKTLTK